MVVQNILAQPDANSLQVAYRPIFFRVEADSLVPFNQPMYGDVYFLIGSTITYYKTFTSYTIEKDVSGNSVFDFDIQDAIQEFLSIYIPTVSVQGIKLASNFKPSVTEVPYSAIQTVVYFRGSTFDTNGLLIPEPTIPIQATATSPATSPYSGYSSNNFISLDATLYFDQIYDYNLGLNAPEQRLINLVPFPIGSSNQRIYGLSNLPINLVTGSTPPTLKNISPEIYPSDHAAFPFIILKFDTTGGLSTVTRHCGLYLHYWSTTDTVIHQVTLISTTLLGFGVYYLPLGLQELSLIVSSTIMNTLLDPNNIIHYRLKLVDNDNGGFPILETPTYRVKNISNEENTRLWFQNSWGHFEQLSFLRLTQNYKTTSSEKFIPYLSTNDGNIIIQNQQRIGRQRYNIRTQEESVLLGLFPEQLINWIKELLSSPIVYMDVPSSGTTPAFLRGFKVEDDTFVTKKTMTQNGMMYEISVKLPTTIDYITLRN